jgi:shikimate dehydrogenase
MQKGQERGAQVANGLEMLVIQAEESWKIWNE